MFLYLAPGHADTFREQCRYVKFYFYDLFVTIVVLLFWVHGTWKGMMPSIIRQAVKRTCFSRPPVLWEGADTVCSATQWHCICVVVRWGFLSQCYNSVETFETLLRFKIQENLLFRKGMSIYWSTCLWLPVPSYFILTDSIISISQVREVVWHVQGHTASWLQGWRVPMSEFLSHMALCRNSLATFLGQHLKTTAYLFAH